MHADPFNRSGLRIVVGLVLYSNTRFLDVPGNILLSPQQTYQAKPVESETRQSQAWMRD